MAITSINVDPEIVAADRIAAIITESSVHSQTIVELGDR